MENIEKIETLLAFGTSHPHLMAHALYPYRRLFQKSAHEGPFSWGTAMCRPPDEIEHKRRPLHMDAIDLYETLQHWQPEVGMAHFEVSRTSRNPNDVSPFRHRNWFFAMTGGSSRPNRVREWLQSAIKGDLRWSVPGNTEQELVFQLFLVFLKETCQLNAYDPDHACVASALAQTYRHWRHLARGVEDEETPAVFCVSNGRFLATYCSMDNIGGFRLIEGMPQNCPYCRDHHPDADERERNHPDLHALVVLGNLRTPPAEYGLAAIPRDRVLFYQGRRHEWIPV